MADPRDEKIEKKLEETGAPNQDSELSDADLEKVAGSTKILPGTTEYTRMSCTILQTC
jgi:hypothetical protein